MAVLFDILGKGQGGLFGAGGGLSQNTFNDIGGAVSDIFAGQAARSKAAGDRFEQQNYNLAASLADQNAQFAEQSAAIKEMQANRQITMGMGRIEGDVAGAGFQLSGSAGDILRDAASQGSLMRSVIEKQGQINVAGYQEQAASYRNMSQAAQVAINAEDTSADNAWLSAGIKGVAALASLA